MADVPSARVSPVVLPTRVLSTNWGIIQLPAAEERQWLSSGEAPWRPSDPASYCGRLVAAGEAGRSVEVTG